MRTKFQFVPFLLLLSFSHLSVSFSSMVGAGDTSAVIAKKQLQSPNRHLHITFAIGTAEFNSSISARSALAASGYPIPITSIAYPDIKPSRPTVYSFTVEGNITKQVLVGVQFSKMLKQTIAGSNFHDLNLNQKPEEQFDAEENYSTKFVNGTINYVVVPANFIHSRFEFTVGAGLSYNRLTLSGLQRFRRYTNQHIYDVTPASYKISKNVLGYLFGGSMDFYWSRYVSNQIKLEIRSTPSLEVPAQTLTYVNTKVVPVTGTRTLSEHPIKYSGVILSFAFRFHI